jgi:hypothetical protein
VITFRAEASDPDGDSLVYSFSSGDQFGWQARDAQGGFSSGVWTGWSISKRTATGLGTIRERVRVRDSHYAMVEAEASVEVINRPPTVSISASPGSVELGEVLVFRAYGVDPDGYPLRYRFGGGALQDSPVYNVSTSQLGPISVGVVAVDSLGVESPVSEASVTVVPVTEGGWEALVLHANSESDWLRYVDRRYQLWVEAGKPGTFSQYLMQNEGREGLYGKVSSWVLGGSERGFMTPAGWDIMRWYLSQGVDSSLYRDMVAHLHRITVGLRHPPNLKIMIFRKLDPSTGVYAYSFGYSSYINEETQLINWWDAHNRFVGNTRHTRPITDVGAVTYTLADGSVRTLPAVAVVGCQYKF